MEPIIAISWVRNEADIIESFVRYHLQIVDRMIIIDHRSDDATPHILSSLVEEGLPLEVRRDDRLAHEQSSALTELLQEISSRHCATWVLPLDADEFVRTQNGNLRTQLNAFDPKIEAIKVQWVSYIPLKDDAKEVSPLKRIQNRLQAETRIWNKVFIHVHPRNNAQKKSLSCGNHELLEADGSDAESTPTDTIRLAHFPVRSVEQCTKKIINGHLSAIAIPFAPPDRASHWKSLYRFLSSGGVITEEVLETIARTYANLSIWTEKFDPKSVHAFALLHSETVLDPLPVPFQLRYTDEVRSVLTPFVAGAEEAILRERYEKEALLMAKGV